MELIESVIDNLLEYNNFLGVKSLFYRNVLARIGVHYCFVLEGIFMGIWGRFLPTIKDNLNLSDSLLGTSVLFVYLGTVIVSPIAALLLRNYGSQISAIIGAWGFIISLPLIPLADNFGELTSVMFTYGVLMGIMDISMNNCAILTEIVATKPLLGSFHGSYSVAAALGSLIGGGLIQIGMGIIISFLSIAIIAFGLSLSTSIFMYDRKQENFLVFYHDNRGNDLRKSLIEDSAITETLTGYNSINTTEENPLTENTQFVSADELFATQQRQSSQAGYDYDDDDHSVSFIVKGEEKFSWKSLWDSREVIAYFSAVGFLAAFGESGIVTWSVEYFDRLIPSSSIVKSLGFTSFMVCMALGRFFCDYLRRIYGRVLIIRVSGILACVGLLIVVISVELPAAAFFACLGFAITGLGLSTLIPIVFSSAGHLSNVHAGTAIATVAACSYSGSIISSPLIGILSDAFGSLQYAILCDAILLGLIFPLSWGIIAETPVFHHKQTHS